MRSYNPLGITGVIDLDKYEKRKLAEERLKKEKADAKKKAKAKEAKKETPKAE